uniref:Glycine-rich protein n=1 Tax=Ononis spinosa TaxID=58890 RepID=A0A411AFJ6_ONOSP|nr:glycine-rich protein [Ononis spinosa]
MMKTNKPSIFMIFLCALVLVSVVAIEPSKDENQFGVQEESKTRNGIDSWRDWGGWSWGIDKEKREAEEGAKGEGGKEEGGKNGIGKENEEGTESSGRDWRDWGGAMGNKY